MNTKLVSVIWAGILGLGTFGTAIILPGNAADAIALPSQLQSQAVPTQRIEFAPGATSAIIRSTGYASPQRYVIRANAGQEMTVEVDSPDNVALSIVGANGQVLLPEPAATSYWSGRLPATEDYYIWLFKPDRATYTLRVDIPANMTPAPEPAQRVEFQSGTTSTVLTGSLPAHTSDTYLVGARQGQYTSVQVNSSNDADFLAMYGKDGIVLANGNMSGARSWMGRLPETEDYVVKVTNPTPYPSRYTMPISIQ